MTQVAQNILDAALALPDDERAQIADQLVASLDAGQAPLSPAWKAEIERRLREVTEGRATLIPHDQVMAEAYERIRARRGT